MNRTIIIFNLLVSSISLGRSIDENTTPKNEGKYSTIEDTITKQSSGDNGDILTISANKDDVLTISDLSKMYKSAESLLAKMRYLKEQPENDAFEIKPDLLDTSSQAQKSKTSDNFDVNLKEGRIAIAKIEPRASSKEESKLLELKPNSKEKSKAVKLDSRFDNKEESESLDVTSEFSELDSTTPTFTIDDKVADYSEKDMNDYKDYEKISFDKQSGKRNLEIINDESNSAWDLLDDIPSTRRMFTRPDNVNEDSKGKIGHEQFGLSKANFPNSNLKLSKTHYQYYGPTHSPTVSIAQINPALVRSRLHIIPGFVTIRTAMPVDFRRILSQERNHLTNQNVPFEPTEKSEVLPESRDEDDLNSEHFSNSYPYTPEELVTPKVAEVSASNTVFAKLIQASENPHKFPPNFIGENVKNLPHVQYNLRPYYDVYKYATGFSRSS